MTLVTVPCAVCQGTTFESIYPSTIFDVATDPSRFFGSSRRRAGHLEIVRCSACGLVLSNPQDDTATLASVYTALEDEAYEGEHDNRRRAARHYLELMRRYQPKPARLLDVGCATGVFVCAAREVGWDATGLDASSWMITRARSRCPAATFLIAGLGEARFATGAFDVITLWDVLEHAPAPRQALESLHRWLRPGGWLLLSVPNVASMTARLMGRHWVMLLREHLWYFSPAIMARLLSRTGFDPVRIRPEWRRFSLGSVVARLTQYPGIVGAASGGLSRLPLAGRLPLRLAIGEMDVVARARP